MRCQPVFIYHNSRNQKKQHLNLAKKSNFPGEQKNVSSLTAHSFEIFNITPDNTVFLTNRRRTK